MLHPLLDRVIEVYTGPDYADEVAQAKAAYFAKTGPIAYRADGVEETQDLDSRMGAFLEWYLFDWLLPRGLSPVEDFAAREGPRLGQADRRILLGLCATLHSLFTVIGLGDQCVYLEDLVGGGRWRVDERRSLTALEAGDLMEARLCPLDGRIVFSPAVAFHPASARAAILDVVAQSRAERKKRSALMLELSRMRIDAERYRHVPVARIYRLAGVLGAPREP